MGNIKLTKNDSSKDAGKTIEIKKDVNTYLDENGKEKLSVLRPGSVVESESDAEKEAEKLEQDNKKEKKVKEPKSEKVKEKKSLKSLFLRNKIH